MLLVRGQRQMRLLLLVVVFCLSIATTLIAPIDILLLMTA